MNPDGTMPDPRIVDRLITAFEMMPYDIGLIGSFESEILSRLGLEPEPFRMTAEASPFVVLESSAGDRIGFLRFPSLPLGVDIPSRQLIQKISSQIEDQRDSVRLLVGLSDWGWVGEREYLAQRPPAVPDILLGSGRGSGVNGRIEADGRCVWVRPYDKGQTVSEVQIRAWPVRSKDFRWKEPDTIRPLTVGLGDDIDDNPDVDAVLQ
ncbi:hypothetical protein GKC30_11185 [Pseudodesulfovibrio sp. F-1]|uniref:Uncharacterized protein n=1 Tax=Pseudodesulfovibrio alkaliphilus TaxID=2661613 RepID=A0A7K1KQ33_9BACT|nr:hypothetical protein [Pseudodesulfovibrio alkaliphilus]MUM78199.1 hypothetical protein [Pseudodesulfovibrio alkaliphilus]